MVSPRVLLSTLRHLRPRQAAHQVLRRLRRPSPHAFPLAWAPLRPRLPRLKNGARAWFDGKGTFDFNNEKRSFAGWNPEGARKLWIYNLHYMAWLFDLEDGREEWMERWIRENPPGSGNGWDPYPVSLRLFNWCKHFAVTGRNPSAAVLASLERQAGWLSANLEFHIDGNHLLENLLALQYAAFFLDPGDARAAAAEARIARLLAAELEDQFLADGGHYELSPMYHAILLERLLDLLNVWPEGRGPLSPLRDLAERKARAALDWLETMSVGGRFALFNDSCYDGAPEAGRLLEFGDHLLGRPPRGGAPLRSLAASGYHRAEAGAFTVIFDAGKLGPDHQMGHAQGDMLSFCLWLGEAPVLVHPGNYEYLPGEMRDYCRSTAAHNTVVVEGGEQAEWWASHRVGRRARPLVAAASVGPGGAVALEGAHDGFRGLPGRPSHRRRLELTPAGVEVRDILTPGPGRPCRAYFHFHPDCSLEPVAGGLSIRTPAGRLRMESELPIRLADSWYCPEFGLRIANRAAVVEGWAPVLRVRIGAV